MTLKLKLLCRVVRRRVERGEDLSEVLKPPKKRCAAVLGENHKARQFYGICASFFEKMCYTG